MFCQISQRLQYRPKVAVIIGAGGTARAACYSLKQLGVDKLYLFNRTAERAEKLADEFGALVCKDLGSLNSVDIVVGTIPAGAQKEDHFPGNLFASKPVVVELAYRPRTTPLLKLAQDAGCQVVEGIDILIEQGLYQFKTWTSCNPPSLVMASAVHKAYNDS